jgi:hypothetical protein
MHEPFSHTHPQRLASGHAWSRREAGAVLAAIAGIWIVGMTTWPLTGQVVPWDSKNHFYPMFRYLGEALAAGVVPLWNPYHFAGHPTVADPQSLLFTPTMAAFAWAMPRGSMQAFDLAVAAHLLIGALGIAGLFARRHWAGIGAVLAAAMFMLGGVAMTRLQHTLIIVSYGWLPVALMMLDRLLDRPTLLRTLTCGLVAGLLAIGRDQIAYLGVLALIGLVIDRFFSAERRRDWAMARALPLAAAGLISVAMVAVPALLTVQFLAQSNRPEIGFGVAAQGSLPPQTLATLLFANVYASVGGGDARYFGPGPLTVEGGSWTDRSVNYLFAGTLPVLLVLWHGLAGRRAFARDIRFFAALTLAALIYALGKFTPLFELLFDLLPGVRLYRRPADAAFVFNFGFAMLAGYLAHRLVTSGAPHRDGGRPLPAILGAGLAILVAIAAAGWAIDLGIKADRLPFVLARVGLALALAAGLVALLVKARRQEMRALAVAGLVALTAGELIVRHTANDLNAEPASYYPAFDLEIPEQREGIDRLREDIAGRRDLGFRPRVEILGLAQGWQNAAMVLRLEDTLGYNALRVSDYLEATGAGENAEDLRLRLFPGTFRGWDSRLAGLLGLEYLILRKPVERLPARYPRPESLTLIHEAPDFRIYRLAPTDPRAMIAYRLKPIVARDVIEAEELPDFDVREEALIDETSIPLLAGDYGARDATTRPDAGTGRAVIRAYKRNRVILEVETDRDAVLVLHDPWYPGWEALVGGERRPVLKVNLLFRGVEVPRGRHIVEFVFRPFSADNLKAALSSARRASRAAASQDP